ncbi:TIGR02587 family membrane protein [Altericroceibacterium xinjiangense]|uniref:TIGR02587 family membrane protein n=1 Tax=Altericroceibacterium xinjiangense TaxID=762261 RepID=UPI000F7D8CDF|nr:TIGR02587 family membrane protein [Altericroceibacterium xinjiangense]
MEHAGRTTKSNRKYAKGLARAFAGAILFSFPLMMTMEMWWLGFYVDRTRLLVFVILTYLLLIPLSRFVGFERTDTVLEDVADTTVAVGVGIITSAIMLLVLGILEWGMAVNEIVGKIAIQTVPASFGAILARGQLAEEEQSEQRQSKQSDDPAKRYLGELIIMTAGALFLAFNVAPTEEMILIAFKMTPLHALALIAISIGVLHAFVYAVGFGGEEEMPADTSLMGGIINYSIAGYGIAILVSLYVLWTFGRTDGASVFQIAMMVAVVGFPSALGAASARLII